MTSHDRGDEPLSSKDSHHQPISSASRTVEGNQVKRKEEENIAVSDTKPADQLTRLLSIDRTVPRPMPSPPAERRDVPEAAAATEREGEWRKIGAGACGAVFAAEGTPVAVKLLKFPRLPDGGPPRSDRESEAASDLWNDFLKHAAIVEKVRQHGDSTDIPVRVRVPDCFGFVPPDSAFWAEHPALVATAEAAIHFPTHGLRTERIPPLPRVTRELLVERYCAAPNREAALADPTNGDCLVRIYLGSMRGQGQGGRQFFSLRNFKMYLGQMLELGLDVCSVAADMATALAVVHWEAHVDARDVEFVLGGSVTEELPADSACHTPALWLLDFNQVRGISLDEAGVEKAADAFMANDPYFPRPHDELGVQMALWYVFSRAYLAKADRILKASPGKVPKEAHELPQMFLRRIAEMQREKLARLAVMDRSETTGGAASR